MKIYLNEYCPCCGYNTFDPNDRLNYNICRICYWEDDPIAFEDPDFEGGANNGISLIQARINFKKFGATEKRLVHYTQQPDKHDVLNPEWNSDK